MNGTNKIRILALTWLLSLAVGSISAAQEKVTPASGMLRSRDAYLGTFALAQVNPPAAEESEDTADKAPEPSENHVEKIQKSQNRREEVVSIGKSVEIKAGETAGSVVVVGGSAKVNGNVNDAVVVVGGDATVNGEVADAVVAVLGNIKLGPEAKIHGEVVSVGGRIEKAEGAVINGETREIDFGAVGLPEIRWLREWFVQCVLKLRPLAPQVGWVWFVAAVIFGLYFLLAAAFPKPVQTCVDELSRRPATTFLLGLLTLILAPFAILILIATGIGAFVVPFLLAALLLFGIVGKIALMEGLGIQIGKQFGGTSMQKPLAALLLGALIITLLYIVPILGLVTWMLVGLWGLGIAVSAAFGGLKRELPPKAPPKTTPAAALAVPFAEPQAMGTAPVQNVSDTSATSVPPISAQQGTSVVPPLMATQPAPLPPPMMLDIRAHPRAGFWERIGAGFLDLVLIIVVSAFVGGMPSLCLLISLAYFAAMWTWRGTTIGGIVVGLKVVRLDGGPLPWHVALVRSLAAAFSTFVLFLGFFWIAWDKEKQGWHDMIAGTVVLRLPRGTPLVCL